MNVLITAGNTQVLLDRVRCLTNIFTGRTGAAIALEACRRGHRVTLLTSHPEAATRLQGDAEPNGERWQQETYSTFEDLRRSMQRLITQAQFDAVIHSAAVSDYLAGGVFAPASTTRFLAVEQRWQAPAGEAPTLVDREAAKIKSDDPELWVRLVRAPKLIDLVRSEWGFGGILVKFKLEVGLGDEELLASAEKSRCQSHADLMVANTLEGAQSWAFLGPLATEYTKVARAELASRLLEAVEKRHG